MKKFLGMVFVVTALTSAPVFAMEFPLDKDFKRSSLLRSPQILPDEPNFDEDCTVFPTGHYRRRVDRQQTFYCAQYVLVKRMLTPREQEIKTKFVEDLKENTKKFEDYIIPDVPSGRDIIFLSKEDAQSIKKTGQHQIRGCSWSFSHQSDLHEPTSVLYAIPSNASTLSFCNLLTYEESDAWYSGHDRLYPPIQRVFTLKLTPPK